AAPAAGGRDAEGRREPEAAQAPRRRGNRLGPRGRARDLGRDRPRAREQPAPADGGGGREGRAPPAAPAPRALARVPQRAAGALGDRAGRGDRLRPAYAVALLARGDGRGAPAPAGPLPGLAAAAARVGPQGAGPEVDRRGAPARRARAHGRAAREAPGRPVAA